MALATLSLLPLLLLLFVASSKGAVAATEIELQNKHIVLWLCGSDPSEMGFYTHDLLHPQAFVHYNIAQYTSYLHRNNISFTKPTENAVVTPLFETAESAIAKHHKPRMLVYNVENCGPDAKYTIVKQYVTMFSSSVEALMHLSDEYMASPRKYKYGEGIEVYKLARRLVLREYGIWPYKGSLDNTTLSKVMQLPLPYHPSMLAQYSSRNVSLVDILLEIKGADEHRSIKKAYNWSFVGTTHGHKVRKECVETFKTWPGFNLSEGIVDWANMNKQNVHPADMFEVYKQSRFVVNGRGAVNLNCFRLYEAILAGAIPVVVGAPWEVLAEFDFNGDSPYFVHAGNATEALTICQSMSHHEVDKKRDELIDWLVRKIRHIRALVIAAME